MTNKTAEILDESHELYRDLNETLTILQEMEAKKELPSDIVPALLGLLGEMVSKRVIPVSLEESLIKLNSVWFEPILDYLYRKEEISKIVQGDIPETRQPIKENKNSTQSPIVEPEKIINPVKPLVSSPEKTVRPTTPPPKKVLPDPIIKLEPRKAEAEVANQLDHIKIENTRIMLLLDILKGHTFSLKREQWDNDDSTLEEIRRICDGCGGLKKILLTNEKKGYPLTDEKSIYALNFMGMENCSIFVVTMDGRILLWKDPSIEFEKSLLDPEGIEPKELFCLIFITQPEPELLEMQFAKFIRTIR